MTSASWLLAALTAYWAAALVIVCLAFWKGDWGEKAGASALALNFGVTLGVQGLYWHGVQIGVMVADLLLLAAFSLIAHRVPRWWPRAAAGFTLLSCVTHPAATFSPAIWTVSYLAVQWVFSALIVLALAAGLWELSFARRHETWRAGLPS